jgi:hypothetical protein
MNTLHIVNASRHRPSRFPPGRCIAMTDDLTDGVLHRERWLSQRLRVAWSGEAIRDLETVCEAAAGLRSFDEVVVWQGPSHCEQMMAAWVVPLLRSLEIAPGAICLATPLNRKDEPVQMSHAEGRDLMRGYMTRKDLDRETETLLNRLWEAVTADGPEALADLPKRALRPLPFWNETREAILCRYPDATGLGFHDRVILAQCSRRWRTADRVVAVAAAESEYKAPISERAVWRRLLRLVSRSEEAGAVAIRTAGHLTPAESEVRLTDLGVQGVEGSIDILSKLPLFEWIGGTLIQAPDRVWRWTEQGLRPDHPAPSVPQGTPRVELPEADLSGVSRDLAHI